MHEKHTNTIDKLRHEEIEANPRGHGPKTQNIIYAKYTGLEIDGY